MSVSKWAYDPDKCDGQRCIGDCDYCILSFVCMDPEADEQDAAEIEDARRGYE